MDFKMPSLSSLRLLLLLLLLSCDSKQYDPVDPEEEVVTALSGQEYLGRFTYFRGWSTRRRLFLVRASNREIDRVLREAVHNYRCELALRNINLVLLGDTKSSETVFFYSPEHRRDFIRTRRLDKDLRRDMGRHLRDLYRDLNSFRQWALLLGYDGGRKRLYLKVNFNALFEKIDSTYIRQREMWLQRQKNIDCSYFVQ